MTITLSRLTYLKARVSIGLSGTACASAADSRCCCSIHQVVAAPALTQNSPTRADRIRILEVFIRITHLRYLWRRTGAPRPHRSMRDPVRPAKRGSRGDAGVRLHARSPTPEPRHRRADAARDPA